MTIQSFGNSLTEKIFLGIKDKEVFKFPTDVLKVAERKLDMVNAATKLQDLASPPGNKLGKKEGDLKGLWAIRINDQWRITFQWLDEGPYEVKITDYH